LFFRPLIIPLYTSSYCFDKKSTFPVWHSHDCRRPDFPDRIIRRLIDNPYQHGLNDYANPGGFFKSARGFFMPPVQAAKAPYSGSRLIKPFFVLCQ
jgi:hypothetical protein